MVSACLSYRRILPVPETGKVFSYIIFKVLFQSWSIYLGQVSVCNVR